MAQALTPEQYTALTNWRTLQMGGEPVCGDCHRAFLPFDVADLDSVTVVRYRCPTCEQVQLYDVTRITDFPLAVPRTTL